MTTFEIRIRIEAEPGYGIHGVTNDAALAVEAISKEAKLAASGSKIHIDSVKTIEVDS